MDEQPAVPDLRALDAALAAIDREARALVAGLSEADGGWRATAGSWSVAECLDHLAHANRAYLAAMAPAARRALADGSRRRRPAVPGLFGRWFVRSLEPPPRLTSLTEWPFICMILLAISMPFGTRAKSRRICDLFCPTRPRRRWHGSLYCARFVMY